MLKPNWVFDWILGESKNKYDIGLIREALSALGEGVRVCSERIDVAHKSGVEEYADAVTDEECDVLETLLGSAFMICQTYIAKVVADVHRLHKTAERPHDGKSGILLTTTTNKKAAIMVSGCPCVAGTTVTVVEAINALANYFKHRDEWPRDWTKATNQAAETVRVIEAIGLEQGSTGNLRHGARALGIPEFHNMNVFANLLEEWHEKLMADYEQELQTKGLVK